MTEISPTRLFFWIKVGFLILVPVFAGTCPPSTPDSDPAEAAANNQAIFLPVLAQHAGISPIGEPDGIASWSAPIAVSPHDNTIWVVNPDSGSVTAVAAESGEKLAEIPVGQEPWSLAVAPGPSGQTSKSIIVNVISSPPAGGVVGADGGVFASEIGSTITIPPGAVPDNTILSVDELSQEEVTARTGIDWEGMGVTFLGAQDIQTSNPFSLPYRVASADFGNRVQPGQAVVNYQIIPDADGDGIDEIVVMNSASVAPNNDVISDPVSPILLDSLTINASLRTHRFLTANDTISGSPGTVVEMEISGLNPYSALGNVAVFTSMVDGTELEIPGILDRNIDAGLPQIFTFLIPAFPTGAATLVIRNESTGFATEPINVTITEATPLSRPAIEIINDYLAQTMAYLFDFGNLTGNQYGSIDDLFASTAMLNDFLAELSSDPMPAEQEFLENYALAIENSGLLNPAFFESSFESEECWSQDYLNMIRALTAGLFAAMGAAIGAGIGGPAGAAVGGIIGGTAAAYFDMRFFQRFPHTIHWPDGRRWVLLCPSNSRGRAVYGHCI